MDVPRRIQPTVGGQPRGDPPPGMDGSDPIDEDFWRALPEYTVDDMLRVVELRTGQKIDRDDPAAAFLAAIELLLDHTRKLTAWVLIYRGKRDQHIVDLIVAELAGQIAKIGDALIESVTAMQRDAREERAEHRVMLADHKTAIERASAVIRISMAAFGGIVGVFVVAAGAVAFFVAWAWWGR